MRKFIVLAALLAVVLLTIPPVAAQGDKPACDPAAVIKKAAGMTSTGDKAKDLAALVKFTGDISAANIACNGYVFKGSGVKVLPPFVLKKAFYKITATSNDFLIVTAQSLEGSDCVAGVKDTLFNLTNDQAKIGAEITLDIKGDCRMVLSTENSSSAWTITFEPME